MSQNPNSNLERNLAGQALQEALSQGAALVDVRAPEQFAAGFIPASLSLPYQPSNFASKLERFLTPNRPVVLVSDNPLERQGAANSLRQTEYDILGYATLNPGDVTDFLQQMSVAELKEAIAEGQFGTDLTVLDVREDAAWTDYHLEGALHIPALQVSERLGELDVSRQIVVMGDNNADSTTVASFLRQKGFHQVANVPEGMTGWARSGYPIRQPDGTIKDQTVDSASNPVRRI